MRILLIANSVSCYGANNSMLDMIIPLKEYGVDITVFLPGKGEMAIELEKISVAYYIIPYVFCASDSTSYYVKWKGFLHNMILLPNAKKIVKRQGIELIHTNASNVDFGAFLAIICHVPHVWHIRELLSEHFNYSYHFPEIERRLLKHADYLIAISKYVARKRLDGKNVIGLYNGFNTEKYIINKEHMFENEIVHVLYCGQITEGKGTLDAIKAIEKIVMLGCKNYRLDIVGERNEYCINLIKYVRKHNLSEYIHFHGHQIDMKPYREKADIAVICSRYEALGRVTVESMLGECFVIGANSGGTAELITEGKTGFLYEVGDIDQLANKILLVHQDKDKSRRIVEKAKQDALKRFDNRKYSVKILNIYKECIDKRKKRRK